MDSTPSPWFDDPGLERAAAVDIHAVCPNCGEPVLNPVPVRVVTANTSEAWCLCANDHVWITKFNPDANHPSKDAA